MIFAHTLCIDCFYEVPHHFPLMKEKNHSLLESYFVQIESSLFSMILTNVFNISAVNNVSIIVFHLFKTIMIGLGSRKIFLLFFQVYYWLYRKLTISKIQTRVDITVHIHNSNTKKTFYNSINIPIYALSLSVYINTQ